MASKSARPAAASLPTRRLHPLSPPNPNLSQLPGVLPRYQASSQLKPAKKPGLRPLMCRRVSQLHCISLKHSLQPPSVQQLPSGLSGLQSFPLEFKFHTVVILIFMKLSSDNPALPIQNSPMALFCRQLGPNHAAFGLFFPEPTSPLIVALVPPDLPSNPTPTALRATLPFHAIPSICNVLPFFSAYLSFGVELTHITATVRSSHPIQHFSPWLIQLLPCARSLGTWHNTYRWTQTPPAATPPDCECLCLSSSGPPASKHARDLAKLPD